jgi:F420-0:gamma-glutamyl ligase-like protein
MLVCKSPPTDTAPVRAVDAAKTNPIAPTDSLRRHALALGKACTASRKRSLGYEHRIAEAARAVALASAAESEGAALESVAEAFDRVEAHAKYAFSIVATYGKERVIREEMLNRIVAASAVRPGG